MLMKIFFISVLVSLWLFAIDSRFLTFGLLVMSLIGFEYYLRSNHQKYRSSTIPGKLKTRLSFLPYLELEYNRQLRHFLPSQKNRLEIFHKKINISGSLINYISGLRKTSFVLDTQLSGSKIYLFGGSTIECIEVPDDYTITSLLQKSINNAAPPLNAFECVSCGAAGATLKANFAHFKGIPIRQDDICIFFFGVNETGFPADVYLTRFPPSIIPVFNLLLTLSKKYQILLFLRFLHKFQTIDVHHPYFTEKSSQIEEEFEKICAQSKEAKFKFLVILQPCLYTRFPTNKQDLKVLKKYFYTARGDATRYLFQTLTTKLQDASYFIDGRRIFDSTDLDVYTDWCHTNYLGNGIISDYIHSVLRQKFFEDDSLS